MAGPHFHDTEGQDSSKSEQQKKEQAEINAEAIKAHVRKHKQRYKMGAAFLAGAYFARKYGAPKIVEVIEEGPEIPKMIDLTLSTDHMKKLLDNPKGAVLWETSEGITINLVSDLHPDA